MCYGCFRFKGTRNGGILENASYFVFTKQPDGTFEAIPVEEWHNFKPVATYRNLNDEEAEDLFARFFMLFYMYMYIYFVFTTNCI